MAGFSSAGALEVSTFVALIEGGGAAGWAGAAGFAAAAEGVPPR